MKVRWLNRDLINGPYMTLALSEKAFLKAMKHCKIKKADAGPWIKTPQSDATAHFLEAPDGSHVCIVALRTKKGTTPEQIVGLLVHESVHIWQQFKRRIGEHEPSDEFEAYSIQSISQNLIAAYSKEKRCR